MGSSDKETRPTLLIFTDRYPVLGDDEPFLTVEVRELARRWQVILIPTSKARGSVTPLPEGVTFEAGLANYMPSVVGRVWGLIASLFDADTYHEIAAFRARALHPNVIAAVLVRGSRMQRAHRWTTRYLRATGHCVAYSWWASTAGYGVARASNECGVPCVTRIHGYELYPEQDRLGRIPFQGSGLARFDAIYSVSRAGADYLAARHPHLEPRVQTAYLGIDAVPTQGHPSVDGVFRVLSCSSCIAIKRLELLAAGVASLLEHYPGVNFTWTHIGSGPTLMAVQRTVNSYQGLAARCTFTGFLPPSAVRELMTTESFDVFVNVSSSEGLPVTLMEAASNGIPLIATTIGGNAEIVSSLNGLLIDANPEPQDLASALISVHSLSDGDRDAMRAASRATWKERFVAENNYSAFSDGLYDLWSSTT